MIGGSTIAEKDVPKSLKRINSMMAIIIDPERAAAGGVGAGLAGEIDTLVDYAKASGPVTEHYQTSTLSAPRLVDGGSA